MENSAVIDGLERDRYLVELRRKFSEIIRFVTLSRMNLYIDDNSFEIVEFENMMPNGYVFANSMSMIVVAGKSIRVLLKTHFNHKDSKAIARRLYGLEDIDDSKSYDVMKEYCNLSAGFLKKICIERDVPVGISLPVVTLGFNEVFSDAESSGQRVIFEDCWKLRDMESNIICSCQIDVIEPEALEGLMDYAVFENGMDDGDDSDYEFL